MNDPYCPTLDEMDLTAEEQFVMDSMAVISDEELIAYRRCSLDSILWFAECKHRERFVERMDPAAEGYFIKRRFRQTQNEDEGRKMIEAEGTTQEDNQIRKRYMLRHKKTDIREALGLPLQDDPLNIEQKTIPSMDAKMTGKDIDVLLNMTLDEFFIDYNHGYSAAKKALRCNHIRTVRELCYMTMRDLVEITGHSMTDLYSIQISLIDAGLDLDLSPEDVIAMKQGKTIKEHEFASEKRSFMERILYGLDYKKEEYDEEEEAAKRIRQRMYGIHEFEKKRDERQRFRMNL